MEPQSRFLDSHGIRLHVRDWGGDGLPVLLLHGMGANTHWFDAMAPLLRGLRPIALDLRGHGESQWADGDKAYGLEPFADDVARAAAGLGLERFSIVAHSLGARVALAFAARKPRALQSLAALDFLCQFPDRPNPRFDKARARPQPYYETEEEVIRRFHLQPPGTLLGQKALRELGAHCVKKAADGRWTWRFDWRSFKLDYAPVWPILAQVAAPSLVIRGERSTVMPQDHFKRVRDGLRASAADIRGAHHHVVLDAPAETARLVSDFLAAAPR